MSKNRRIVCCERAFKDAEQHEEHLYDAHSARDMAVEIALLHQQLAAARAEGAGRDRANQALRAQLRDAEAGVRRQHADCQAAEEQRSEAARLSHEFRNDRDRLVKELTATNILLDAARDEARQRTTERDDARASHQLQQRNTEHFLGKLKDAEARLAAPCLEPLPPSVSTVYPLGPCIVTGPHREHRARSGASWWLTEESGL